MLVHPSAVIHVFSFIALFVICCSFSFSMMAEKLKEAARVADEDAPVEQGDSQLLGMPYYHLYFYRVVGFFG